MTIYATLLLRSFNDIYVSTNHFSVDLTCSDDRKACNSVTSNERTVVGGD